MIKKIFFFSTFSIFIAACGDKKNVTPENKMGTSCTITVEEIQTALIGKPLSEAGNFNKCFIVKDTLLEGDEEIPWKAKAYYLNGNFEFVAEANVLDSINFTRITIEGKDIATKNGIRVGDNAIKITPFINLEMLALPDGYISFSDKNMPKIFYQLNSIDFTSPEILEKEIRGDIKKIPSTMKVSAIVINGL